MPWKDLYAKHRRSMGLMEGSCGMLAESAGSLVESLRKRFEGCSDSSQTKQCRSQLKSSPSVPWYHI